MQLETIKSYHSRQGSTYVVTPTNTDKSSRSFKSFSVKPQKSTKAVGLKSEPIREILTDAFLQFRGTVLPEMSLNYLEDRVFRDSFTVSPLTAASTILKLMDESTEPDFYQKMNRLQPFEAPQDSHRLRSELLAEDRKNGL